MACFKRLGLRRGGQGDGVDAGLCQKAAGCAAAAVLAADPDAPGYRVLGEVFGVWGDAAYLVGWALVCELWVG